MATCKDCLHVEVCKFKDLPAPLSDSYIRESECIEKRCGNFKDRSRFVELPCKVGDFVYLVTNLRTIGKYLVTSILIRKSLVDINWKMIDGVGYPTPFVGAEKIGKTVFLSREEAEQALKEKEEKENG